MVEHAFRRNVVRKPRFVDKSEVIKLVFISTENAHMHIWVTTLQNQRDDKTEIPIAPNTNAVPLPMGNRLKTIHSMRRYTHQLGERRNFILNSVGNGNHTRCGKQDQLLHKPIEAATAKLAASQVVLCTVFTLLKRRIGNHHHARTARKGPRSILDHRTNSLVDKRHGQFLRQYLRRTSSLVITYICIANGKIGRTHQNAFGYVNIHLHRLEYARRYQTVYAIKHGCFPSKPMQLANHADT